VKTLTAEVRLRLSSTFALDCALEVPSGFTVLFGHSGSGKTSLLDCIAGIRSPDSGRVQVDDQTLFDSAKALDLPSSDRKLAYVFQSLALFPHMSVLENVAYGLKHEAERRREERCRSLLAQFGIDGLHSRRPADLSGGERQRVALARSLVTDPRALLLDEPLAALDRPMRMKIIDDLRSWNSDHGVPILYVTHSVREAMALGERVLLMKDGGILASGSPSELLDPDDWE
jgi:molybdate transport system ATP-binding protein